MNTQELFAQLYVMAWPYWVVVLGAFVSLLTSVLPLARAIEMARVSALVTLGVAAAGFGFLLSRGTQWVGGFLTIDPLSCFLGALLCGVGILTILLSARYLNSQEERVPEAVPLLLFCVAGMALLGASTHLLTLVLSLELMSLGLYGLVGMRRQELGSGEAALKYFLLGSVAAAFLLLGVAFLYGATGHFDVVEMLRQPVSADRAFLFRLGVVLVLAGFGFKVAAVPFHFWAPDVYQGSPMPMVGFMAAGVKVAAFGALVRLLWAFVPWQGLHLISLFSFLTLATVVVGNLAALRQRSLKRILAYSSISHAGYLLLGLSTVIQAGSGSEVSLRPILFYLLVYSLLSLGAFGILTALSRGAEEVDSLDQLRGLGSRSPFLAAALSIFLISLAGIPPSAGFMAKYLLFAQAIEYRLYGLSVVAILMSAVSLYYYLSPVVKMYFYEPQEGQQGFAVSRGLRFVLVLMLLAVFYWGMCPQSTLGVLPERVSLEVSQTSILQKGLTYHAQELR